MSRWSCRTLGSGALERAGSAGENRVWVKIVEGQKGPEVAEIEPE